jgi:hypothetical protein
MRNPAGSTGAQVGWRRTQAGMLGLARTPRPWRPPASGGRNSVPPDVRLRRTPPLSKTDAAGIRRHARRAPRRTPQESWGSGVKASNPMPGAASPTDRATTGGRAPTRPRSARGSGPLAHVGSGFEVGQRGEGPPLPRGLSDAEARMPEIQLMELELHGVRRRAGRAPGRGPGPLPSVCDRAGAERRGDIPFPTPGIVAAGARGLCVGRAGERSKP